MAGGVQIRSREIRYVPTYLGTFGPGPPGTEAPDFACPLRLRTMRSCWPHDYVLAPMIAAQLLTLLRHDARTLLVWGASHSRVTEALVLVACHAAAGWGILFQSRCRIVLVVRVSALTYLMLSVVMVRVCILERERPVMSIAALTVWSCSCGTSSNQRTSREAREAGGRTERRLASPDRPGNSAAARRSDVQKMTERMFVRRRPQQPNKHDVYFLHGTANTHGGRWSEGGGVLATALQQ